MRKLPVKKILTSLMVLLLMLMALAPAIAEARSGDGTDIKGSTSAVHFQEGEGEEGGAAEGNLAGTGIALGLIGFILILLGVVAVIGAASLGIIGLGYWQSDSGGD